MSEYFNKVKDYLLELDYNIIQEDPNDEVFVIESEGDGISNMVIGIADPIVILEQFIIDIKYDHKETYIDLLKKNRDIVHGAFVLDETGKKLIYRDTLQMESLDLKEIQGSIQSLSLLLSEFSDEIIKYSKN